MYLSEIVKENCPGVVSILLSDSRFKKALIYYLAEMKLQEFKNVGFHIENDKEIVTMFNLIKTGMIKGAYMPTEIKEQSRKRISDKAGQTEKGKRPSNLPTLNKKKSPTAPSLKKTKKAEKKVAKNKK